jgi:hypothetical protein
MEFPKYITNYIGINYRKFINFMKDERILLTGSTALYFYLLQEGIEPNFQPNDLDIFISSYKTRIRDDFQIVFSGYNLINNRTRVINSEYEFKESYYKNMDKNFVVQNYKNSEDKKVQIIMSEFGNIKKYIRAQFDLTVCMCWFNPKTEKFESAYEETKNMIMIINKENINQDRLSKYYSRGFMIPRQLKYIKKVLYIDNRLYEDNLDLIELYI